MLAICGGGRIEISLSGRVYALSSRDGCLERRRTLTKVPQQFLDLGQASGVPGAFPQGGRNTCTFRCQPLNLGFRGAKASDRRRPVLNVSRFGARLPQDLHHPRDSIGLICDGPV